MNNTTQNRQSRGGSRSSQSARSGGNGGSRGGQFSRGGGGGGSRFSDRRSSGGGGSRGGSRGGNGGSRFSRGGGGGRRGRSGGRKMPTFNPMQFINTNPVEAKQEVYNAKNTFETFGFDPKLAATVTSLGITIPSPIQDQIIPEIMKGHDVIGLAETGTGKTAAFLLPLIEKTVQEPNRQTLILTPTRELAIQIEDELRKLARGFRIFSVTCVGGTGIRPQMYALRRPNHFIIGTPGRVLDLIKRGSFNPATVNTVVLDEADRMLDMGFIHDMRSILSKTPKERETLFFSATMSPATETLVHDFLNNPVRISVKKKDVTNSIAQDVVRFTESSKFETLTKLLEDPEFKRVIIFGAMKHGVERLSQELTRAGIKSESIHGNKTHGGRQMALKKFKSGNARVLVATDVAARGIHVESVSHVINYDLPNTFEDYVHRIGRTGRGDKRGKALTFVSGSARY